MPERTPRASRPYMPEYGILREDEGSGLLPWEWAEERLAKSRNYWIGSVSPEGRPHSMPVWGVWIDGALYFSSGPQSRKARNLARDPRCTATTEYAGEAVIVEGIVDVVMDHDELARFKSAYDPKYQWEMDVQSGPIYRVTPVTVFGFKESAEQFTGAATRWQFD